MRLVLRLAWIPACAGMTVRGLNLGFAFELPISPTTAPSSGALMGGFGNRLFELHSKPCFLWLVRASSIDAQEGEQRREKAGGGALSFGYFPLGKQRKVTRKSGETDGL